MSVRVEVGTCIAVCKVFTAVHALTCCRGCGAVNSLLDRALVSTYVDASPFLTPCHGDCDGLVVWNTLDVRVQCSSCRTEYCPQDRCRLPMHAPLSCDEMMTWADLGGCVDLSTKATADLRTILATTKPCPNCGVRTERNQGCVRCYGCHGFACGCALSLLAAAAFQDHMTCQRDSKGCGWVPAVPRLRCYLTFASLLVSLLLLLLCYGCGCGCGCAVCRYEWCWVCGDKTHGSSCSRATVAPKPGDPRAFDKCNTEVVRLLEKAKCVRPRPPCCVC